MMTLAETLNWLLLLWKSSGYFFHIARTTLKVAHNELTSLKGLGVRAEGVSRWCMNI